MMNLSYAPQRGGAQAYQHIGRISGVEGASPHALIELLMSAALDKIAAAKGFMLRDEPAPKGQAIGKSIAIIDELRFSLDQDKGGEIAANLYDLYEYMTRTLVRANAANDSALLDEVSQLLLSLRDAWRAIGDQSGDTASAA